MNQNFQKEISIETDSTLENVHVIGKKAKDVCQKLNLNEVETYEIELCIVEACTNVIRHAYKEKPGNIIKVTISLKDRCNLIISVYDWGEGMDPKNLYEADSDLYQFSEGGRGLFIIKNSWIK